MKLSDIVAYSNDLLRIATVPDYPNALNGLQLENERGEVTKIAASVDAHLPVVKQAVTRGCDFLLVHHGILWGGAQSITGALFEKIKTAADNGVAIYSAHLPLDGHAELGNAVLLGKALDIDGWTSFYPFKDFDIGVRAAVELTRREVGRRLEKALGAKPHLCAAGPEKVRHIGIITGGAGEMLASVKALGIDTFITGEGPHWSYTLAEELGINVFYGGHYATETFGVKALGEHLSKKFKLPWEFIDHPTGM